MTTLDACPDGAQDGEGIGEDAGLVEARREGRETRYRLEAEPLAGAMSWMAGVGGRWDERLAALRGRLERSR